MSFIAGAKINKGDLLEVRDDGLLYPINSEPKRPEPPKLRKIKEGDCCPRDEFLPGFINKMKRFFGCGGCKPAPTIPDLPYWIDLTDEDKAMLSGEFNRQVSRMNP